MAAVESGFTSWVSAFAALSGLGASALVGIIVMLARSGIRSRTIASSAAIRRSLSSKADRRLVKRLCMSTLVARQDVLWIPLRQLEVEHTLDASLLAHATLRPLPVALKSALLLLLAYSLFACVVDTRDMAAALAWDAPTQMPMETLRSHAAARMAAWGQASTNLL